MNIQDVLRNLSESSTQFSPRNNQVAKSTINTKLKANGYNLDVKSPNSSLEYDGGNGVVPLKCKKDPSHKLVNNGKFTFNSLSQKFIKGHPEELCKPCADEKGVALKGTGSSEMDLFNDIKTMLPRILGDKSASFEVHGGNAGKVKSEYKTQNSLDTGKKKTLDYDIYIEDKNGGKNIAINVDGPSHNIYNPSVEADDMIRATENFKDNRSFFITPHSAKGTPAYNQILKNIEEYIKFTYNKWINPKDSNKMKALANKVGENSEAYQQTLKAKTEKFEQHSDEVKNSAINRKLYDLVYALLNNNGYNSLGYSGKYNNLIDYLLKDPKAKESFANNRDEWRKLLSTNKAETKKWIESHKSNNPKTFLKLNNGALFEDKKDR